MADRSHETIASEACVESSGTHVGCLTSREISSPAPSGQPLIDFVKATCGCTKKRVRRHSVGNVSLKQAGERQARQNLSQGREARKASSGPGIALPFL